MTAAPAPAPCTAYLVRFVETQRVVGVFCARDSRELFRLLDEQVDPEECEYLALAAGDGAFFDAQFVERAVLVEDDEEIVNVVFEPAEPLYEVDLESVPPEQAHEVQMTSRLAERVNGRAALTEWQLFDDNDVQQAG